MIADPTEKKTSALTPDKIATDGSKYLYTIFPKGGINKIHRNGSFVKTKLQNEFAGEWDRASYKLEKKYRDSYSAKDQATPYPKTSGYLYFDLDLDDGFRDEMLNLSMSMAKKYGGYGLCSDLVRVGTDYLQRTYGQEVSVTHIQIRNPKNPKDVYHELIVLGLNETDLVTFSQKKFNHVSGLVFDPWNDKTVLIKGFHEYLNTLAKEQQKGIFKNLSLTDINSFNIVISRHYQSSQKKLTTELTTVSSSGIIPFFKTTPTSLPLKTQDDEMEKKIRMSARGLRTQSQSPAYYYKIFVTAHPPHRR